MTIPRENHILGLTGFLASIVTASTCAGAPPPLAQRRPTMRAAPPTRWEPVVRETFEADAFARLNGQRPAFGESPTPPPEEDKEFDRADVMRELKRASTTIEELLASEQAIARPAPQARKAIEAVLAQAHRLANDDPDYSADVHYVRHAEQMAIAARQLKKLLGTAEHGEAGRAVRSIRQSCDACHAAFNP